MKPGWLKDLPRPCPVVPIPRVLLTVLSPHPSPCSRFTRLSPIALGGTLFPKTSPLGLLYAPYPHEDLIKEPHVQYCGVLPQLPMTLFLLPWDHRSPQMRKFWHCSC